MLAVPSIHHGFSGIPVGPRAYAHSHCCVIDETNRRSSVTFCNIESVAPSLEVMAFTSDKFPLGLPILVLEFRLIATNPAQPRNNSHPHRVIIKTERSCHSHPAVRRVNPNMEVFDVLVDHVDRSPPYLNAVSFPLSIHSAPLQSRICGTRGPRCRRVATL